MVQFLKKWILSVVLILALIGNQPVSVQARNQGKGTFSEEYNILAALRILPEEIDPIGNVTYQQFVKSGESLLKGWKDDSLSYELGITVPEGLLITYREALKIAGMYLGYMEYEGIPRFKKLTPKLQKADDDRITGSDMAYIFYNVLHSKHRIGSKTILEERYMQGSEKLLSSRIMRITSSEIELEDEGVLPLANDFKIYRFYDGQIQSISFQELFVGMEGLQFFLNQEGEIQTVLVRGKPFPEKIRVLVSQEIDKMGKSLSHDFDELEIMANEPFKVLIRENGKFNTELIVQEEVPVTFTNRKGQIKITLGEMSVLVSDRVYLDSYYPHTLYFVNQSTKRQGVHPQYQGKLEISPSTEESALYLINELPIEWYLRRVVPSEVPASWEKETFKVQAIAARSYAIFQILAGRYESKSAHVDDSTAFQVYNNCIENPIVNEAIEETRGIVPLYDGKLIDAVFFSTSAGYTAGNEEVWHSPWPGALPRNGVAYLRPTSQVLNAQVPDLTVEENALAFFKDQSVESYDSDSPYFRWRIEWSREMLENTINKNLVEREKVDQHQGVDIIQTLSGTPIDTENFSIGQLQDLKVVQRGQGGNIMILDIIGTNGTYRVMKEYNIRMLLQPTQEMVGIDEDVLLYLHDGSTYPNYSILPSAFVAFEIEWSVAEKIEKVISYGGGNGHGVGMSQWGMRGMVELGYDYEAILQHFYRGIELKKVY